MSLMVQSRTGMEQIYIRGSAAVAVVAKRYSFDAFRSVVAETISQAMAHRNTTH